MDVAPVFDVPELENIKIEGVPTRRLMAAHNQLIGHYAGNELALSTINIFFRDIVETRLFQLFTAPEGLTPKKLTSIKALAQFFSMTIIGEPFGYDYVHDTGESIMDIDAWLRFEFTKQETAQAQLEQLFVRINQAEIIFNKEN